MHSSIWMVDRSACSTAAGSTLSSTMVQSAARDWNRGQSLEGTPSKAPTTAMGIGRAKYRTKFIVPAGNASSMSAVICSTTGRIRCTRPGVKAADTSRRRRVCRGGLRNIMLSNISRSDGWSIQSGHPEADSRRPGCLASR
jgi:hypothetical protein